MINIESWWKSIGQVFVIIDFIDFCNSMIILTVLIAKYRKDKNGRSRVCWLVFLLRLVHHHSLELINSNSYLILNSINISITLYSLSWYRPHKFVCHYRVLRGIASAQIERKHNHKSNNVTWLLSFSVTTSCSF